jgi:hypothetical protein
LYDDAAEVKLDRDELKDVGVGAGIGIEDDDVFNEFGTDTDDDDAPSDGTIGTHDEEWAKLLLLGDAAAAKTLSNAGILTPGAWFWLTAPILVSSCAINEFKEGTMGIHDEDFFNDDDDELRGMEGTVGIDGDDTLRGKGVVTVCEVVVVVVVGAAAMHAMVLVVGDNPPFTPVTLFILSELTANGFGAVCVDGVATTPVPTAVLQLPMLLMVSLGLEFVLEFATSTLELLSEPDVGIVVPAFAPIPPCDICNGLGDCGGVFCFSVATYEISNCPG